MRPRLRALGLHSAIGYKLSLATARGYRGMAGTICALVLQYNCYHHDPAIRDLQPPQSYRRANVSVILTPYPCGCSWDQMLWSKRRQMLR